MSTPTWSELRARAARRERARRRRIEAERASTEWPEFAPQSSLGRGALGAAQEADRQIARLYAERARRLAEFTGTRPASGDRAQGEPGAMSAERWSVRPEILKPVSEWATQEAAIGLTRSQSRAQALLAESCSLVAKLPGTLAALDGGLLTPEHLRPLLEHVAPIADPQLRAEIEAEVLRWVADRAAKQTITAPAQLADRVLRVVTRRDARDAAQQALKALRERGVFRQAERGVGLAGLGVVGTVPEIEALHAALSACVDALPPDPADTRTRGQKMLEVLCDLVLRPGQHDVPPVQVILTLVAGVQTVLGGDQPAELNGQVVSAETARQLLNALTGAGLGDGVLAECEADWQRRLAAGQVDDPDPITDGAWLASVQARPAGGGIDLAFDPGFDRALAAAQQRWEADFAAGRIADPDPPDDPPDDPPGTGPGSWGAADSALAEAAAAQWQAEQAVARAGRLVRAAARADKADEAAWRESNAGRVDAAEDAMTALLAADRADRAALCDLLARTGGGGLAERPRIALVDALSGALVALTDLPGLRRIAHCGRPACRRNAERCEHDLTGRSGLGAPPPTDGYRPGAELDRFIRLRDRRCRWPGCRRPVRKGELDHRVRWPDGPTDVTNLAGLCTGDHRGKHQAPGFRVDLTDDGALVVTTPSGISATTDPPPF